MLFVAGQNNGKMLARNGGKRFNYVIVRVDPRSDAALRESLVPISEMGFENMTRILIRLLDENIRHDPAGTIRTWPFIKTPRSTIGPARGSRSRIPSRTRRSASTRPTCLSTTSCTFRFACRLTAGPAGPMARDRCSSNTRTKTCG